MKTKVFLPSDWVGLGLVAALLPLLAGCVAEHDRTRVRVQEPVYVRSEVTVEDDYVYYPGYEVYYSSNRHYFVYRDGRNWVTRSAPPRVSVDVLFASPSVRVDFHDSPARHHATVIKTYPRGWRQDRDNRDHRSHGRHDNRNNGHKGDNDDDNRKRD